MSNLFSANTVNADNFFFFKLLRRNFSIFFWVGRRQFCTYSTLYDQYTSKGGRCSITANHISIKKNFRENFGQQNLYYTICMCCHSAFFIPRNIFTCWMGAKCRFWISIVFHCEENGPTVWRKDDKSKFFFWWQIYKRNFY